MAELDYVRRNYDALISEIRGYEEKYSRRITLVSVTKSGTDDEVAELLKCGAADIGENRPTELKRRGELFAALGYTPVLHEIGNLQRNKVKLVVGRAALIHSVGKIELAEEISRRASSLGIVQDILVEVNSANEVAKGGISFGMAKELIRDILPLPALRIRGIMTMGPVCDDPEDIRPYFKETKRLFDEVAAEFGITDPILSMGMSDSYRIAIEEGSTLVRVGRKLFDKN